MQLSRSTVQRIHPYGKASILRQSWAVESHRSAWRLGNKQKTICVCGTKSILRNERFMLKYWMIVGITLLLGGLLSGCYSSYGIMQEEHAGESGAMRQRSMVERLDTPAPKTQDLRLINIRPQTDVTDSRSPTQPGDALNINIQPPIPAPDDLDYAPQAITRTAAEMYGGEHHGEENSEQAGMHEGENMHAAEGSEGEHGSEGEQAENFMSEMPVDEDSLRAQVRELTAKAQELSERLERLNNE